MLYATNIYIELMESNYFSKILHLGNCNFHSNFYIAFILCNYVCAKMHIYQSFFFLKFIEKKSCAPKCMNL